LLVGILLARTVAGETADRWGWRSVYWIAASAMVVLAGLVWLFLPRHQPESSVGAFKLAASMGELLRSQPLLRSYSASSALSYACFSVFWSTLAFLLFSLPEHYGPAVAGRFGLAGAAGALTVPLIARWSNRRGTHFWPRRW
jgi:nitrate/nitrite transporter NarK